MRTIESIKKNEVVHCPTEEQAIAFCKLAFGQNWRTWANDWHNNSNRTCYRLIPNRYSPKLYFLEQGYKVTCASEFLPKPEVCQLFDLNVQLHKLKESQQILTDLAEIKSRIDQDHYLKGQKITLTDK